MEETQKKPEYDEYCWKMLDETNTKWAFVELGSGIVFGLAHFKDGIWYGTVPPIVGQVNIYPALKLETVQAQLFHPIKQHIEVVQAAVANAMKTEGPTQ